MSMSIAHTTDVNLAAVSSPECSLHNLQPGHGQRALPRKAVLHAEQHQIPSAVQRNTAPSFLGDSPQKILSLGQFLALEYRINVLTFKPLNTGNQG